MLLIRMIIRSVLVVGPMALCLNFCISAIGPIVDASSWPVPVAKDFKVGKSDFDDEAVVVTLQFPLHGSVRVAFFGRMISAWLNTYESRFVLYRDGSPFSVYKVDTINSFSEEIVFIKYSSANFKRDLNYCDELKLFIPNYKSGAEILLFKYNPSPVIVSHTTLMICGLLILFFLHIAIVESKVIHGWFTYGKELGTIDSWILTYCILYCMLGVLGVLLNLLVAAIFYIIKDKYELQILTNTNTFDYCMNTAFKYTSIFMLTGFIFFETLIRGDVRILKIKLLGQDVRLTPIFKDEVGILYTTINNTERFCVVEVVNSTPNHPEHHFIPVPLTVTTPKEAVAWTFGVPTLAYKPLVQT